MVIKPKELTQKQIDILNHVKNNPFDQRFIKYDNRLENEGLLIGETQRVTDDFWKEVFAYDTFYRITLKGLWYLFLRKQ